MGGNKVVNSTLLPFQLSLLFKKCIVSIDEFTCGHIPYRFKLVKHVKICYTNSTKCALTKNVNFKGLQLCGKF